MSNGYQEMADPAQHLARRIAIGDFGPRELVSFGKAASPQTRYASAGGYRIGEELGRSGLRHWGGFVFEEWLRELQQGRRAAEVYRDMMDSDPIVGSIMYLIQTLIRRVSWRVEPGDSSAEAKKGADWYWGVLNDMRFSWEDTLGDIISFLGYGYCLPGDQTVLDWAGRPRRIDRVAVGDEVLTLEGRAQRVTHVFTREFEGDLIAVKLRGYPHEIRMTPEHRVPTLDGWRRAGDLTLDDELLRPRPILAPGGDYDEGWLVGVYIAEGNRDRGRTRVSFSVHENEVDELGDRLDRWAAERGLEYALATHRSQHGAPVARRLRGRELDGRVPGRAGRGGRVSFSHEALRALIDEWVGGGTARSKHLKKLPETERFARGVIDGWAWGDGNESLSRGYKTRTATTVSGTLAQQMQLLAGSLGLPSHMTLSAGGLRNQPPGAPEGVTPDSYNVGLLPPRTIIRKWSPELYERAVALAAAGIPQRVIGEELGVSAGMIGRWLKRGPDGPMPHGKQPHVHEATISHQIIGLRRVRHKGTVYDLEVEEDHTFCAGPVAVSNSYHEEVYKYRNGESRDPVRTSKFDDGTIGLAKLPTRAQDSLWKWVFDDNGEVEGMIQNPPPDYLLRFIPREKALHFRTTIYKDNPEARSVLRSAYTSFYFARNMRAIEGIGVERDLAGLPVVKPPQEIDLWNPHDPATAPLQAMAQNMVSSIRRDEQEGVILPFGWELELLTTGGRRQFDVGAIINRYETRMAMTILADVVMLGQDKVGSYALAVTKKDMLAMSLGGHLDIIASQFNADQIPRLWRLNGFTWPQPKLVHGTVETIDLDTLGNYLARLGQSGAPIDWTNVLEWAMQMAGAPAPSPGHDFTPRNLTTTVSDTGPSRGPQANSNPVAKAEDFERFRDYAWEGA